MHAETWVPDPKNSNQSVSVLLSVRLRLVTNNGILNDESRSYLHRYIQSLATQMFDQQTSKSMYIIYNSFVGVIELGRGNFLCEKLRKLLDSRFFKVWHGNQNKSILQSIFNWI